MFESWASKLSAHGTQRCRDKLCEWYDVQEESEMRRMEVNESIVFAIELEILSVCNVSRERGEII